MQNRSEPSAEAWLERGWWISIPGLSKQRAEAIVQLIRDSGMGDEADLADPSRSLVLSMDRTTAEWLSVALSESPAEVKDLHSTARVTVSPSSARQAMDALREDIEDFLQTSSDLPPEM